MGTVCCSTQANQYTDAPGAKRGRDGKDPLQEAKKLRDPACERKLKDKDYEMNLQDI